MASSSKASRSASAIPGRPAASIAARPSRNRTSASTASWLARGRRRTTASSNRPASSNARAWASASAPGSAACGATASGSAGEDGAGASWAPAAGASNINAAASAPADGRDDHGKPWCRLARTKTWCRLARTARTARTKKRETAARSPAIAPPQGDRAGIQPAPPKAGRAFLWPSSVPNSGSHYLPACTERWPSELPRERSNVTHGRLCTSCVVRCNGRAAGQHGRKDLDDQPRAGHGVAALTPKEQGRRAEAAALSCTTLVGDRGLPDPPFNANSSRAASPLRRHRPDRRLRTQR